MRKHKIWDFDIEKLQLILNSSATYSEVCEKLKLTYSRSMAKMIMYRIKIDNLSTFLFKENQINHNKTFKVAQSLESILIKNSTYVSTNSLKKKLLKAGLLEYKCVECGNIGEWNTKPLVLQLDHLNGVSNDNRLENLRILCPNCHSQTETFTNKKQKVKIKKIQVNCKGCNKVSNGKVFCNSCQEKFSNRRRKVERPDIKTLIKDVNENGYSATGRKYGVSDNAIRKWIKSMHGVIG